MDSGLLLQPVHRRALCNRRAGTPFLKSKLDGKLVQGKGTQASHTNQLGSNPRKQLPLVHAEGGTNQPIGFPMLGQEELGRP